MMMLYLVSYFQMKMETQFLLPFPKLQEQNLVVQQQVVLVGQSKILQPLP